MALSYKVFPGTPYYSNTSLTTKAGEIVNTTAATYVNTTYGTVSVGGSTYYVAYGQMVSFWNSSFTGQEIDDAVTKARSIEANPTLAGTEGDLTALKIGDVKYKVPSGSSAAAVYTFVWDKVNAAGTRANAAAGITTDTTHFAHHGSVDASYDNPFDRIMPWAGRKLCNISVPAYMALTSTDIKDCVTAWEDDTDFSYSNQYGVWVYTPSFYGRSYEENGYRYFDVSMSPLDGGIHYPEMITGRYLGVQTTLTIGGTSKTCLLPTLGMPIANVALSDQHAYAKNYGASLVDIYAQDASVLLFVVEYATMNSDAIGYGVNELYVQGLHLSSSASNTKSVRIAANENIIPNAIFDIGDSDGGNNIARTYVTAVSGTTVTLAANVTASTSKYVSIHGLINIADAAIGGKSGYIGTNGKCNAYYRGEALWGNKWQYVLGCYRQTGTNKLWIASRGTTDNYDALDTTVHIDTGVVLPTVSAASWQTINALGMCAGLSAPPFITQTGGTSENPVGDGQYLPLSSTADTICRLGGAASNGAIAGAFAAHWNGTASSSYWHGGSRPRLKNPS